MPSGSSWAVVHIRGNHLDFGSKAVRERHDSANIF